MPGTDEWPGTTPLNLDWFKPLQGDAFALSAEATTLDLVLTEVTPMRARAGLPRQPFSLGFEGTRGRLCPQGIYRIDHATAGAIEILLVPLGRNRDDTYRYQAVFA